MGWKEDLYRTKKENIYMKFNSMNQLQENKVEVIYTILQKIYDEKIKNKNKQKVEIMILGIHPVDFVIAFDNVIKNSDYRFINSECSRMISSNDGLPSNECIITFDNNTIFVNCLDYDDYLDNLQKYDVCVLILSHKVRTKGTKQMIYLSDKFEDNDLYTIKFTEKNLPLEDKMEHYIEKLFLELEEIPMNEKTTMTRERIITMINNLEDLRKRIIKNY